MFLKRYLKADKNNIINKSLKCQKIETNKNSLNSNIVTSNEVRYSLYLT